MRVVIGSVGHAQPCQCWQVQMICEHGEPRGATFCPLCRRKSVDTATLPYAGTSGWSGSQTSFERVKIRDESGMTAKYQKMFLVDLEVAGNAGLTSREWGLLHNLEHQTYSSVPSVLHLGGYVARLTQRRNRHQIYVLPQWVNDRTLSPHKSNVKKIVTCTNCGHDLEMK
jgi:hypothetical protein